MVSLVSLSPVAKTVDTEFDAACRQIVILARSATQPRRCSGRQSRWEAFCGVLLEPVEWVNCLGGKWFGNRRFSLSRESEALSNDPEASRGLVGHSHPTIGLIASNGRVGHGRGVHSPRCLPSHLPNNGKAVESRHIPIEFLHAFHGDIDAALYRL